MAADISIIVVNLNTRELLRECLASVFRSTGSLSMEVIVIDNGSSDGSAEMVLTDFPAVGLIRNSTNEGFARPNNVGMELAQGRHVLLLNSDTVVDPGACPTLVRFLDEHPDVGACGPMLVYPDGRMQRSAKGFPSTLPSFPPVREGRDALF